MASKGSRQCSSRACMAAIRAWWACRCSRRRRCSRVAALQWGRLRGATPRDRRDPDQRDIARGARSARREWGAPGNSDRAREPARTDQQHLQRTCLARAPGHAGRIRRSRPGAHGVSARIRHRAQSARRSARTQRRSEHSRFRARRPRAARTGAERSTRHEGRAAHHLRHDSVALPRDDAVQRRRGRVLAHRG